MKTIFTRILRWLLTPLPGGGIDPLDGLTARDRADLPTYHPRDERMPRGCETAP